MTVIIRYYEGIESVAVIGNYLPRQCGLATFTTDLVEKLSVEERIKQWSHYELDGHSNLHALIRELKIHLAEQEIMNEELRQTIKLMDDGKEKE